MSGMVILTSVSQFLKASSQMVVNTLPERVRLTYFPADSITSAILGSVGLLAPIVIFIGFSGPLIGWLSRYVFNASGLLIA